MTPHTVVLSCSLSGSGFPRPQIKISSSTAPNIPLHLFPPSSVRLRCRPSTYSMPYLWEERGPPGAWIAHHVGSTRPSLSRRWGNRRGQSGRILMYQYCGEIVPNSRKETRGQYTHILKFRHWKSYTKKHYRNIFQKINHPRVGMILRS